MSLSRYKESLNDEKLKEVDDLVNIAKRLEDEILTLQAQLDMTKTKIKEIMSELNVDEHGKVRIIRESEIQTDLLELYKNHKSVANYAVGTVDQNNTLSYMYEDHIDFKVAKRMLEKAIEDTKIKEVQREYVKIKK